MRTSGPTGVARSVSVAFHHIVTLRRSVHISSPRTAPLSLTGAQACLWRAGPSTAEPSMLAWTCVKRCLHQNCGSDSRPRRRSASSEFYDILQAGPCDAIDFSFTSLASRCAIAAKMQNDMDTRQPRLLVLASTTQCMAHAADWCRPAATACAYRCFISHRFVAFYPACAHSDAQFTGAPSAAHTARHISQLPDAWTAQ
jgi:hypothetical protein